MKPVSDATAHGEFQKDTTLSHILEMETQAGAS